MKVFLCQSAIVTQPHFGQQSIGNRGFWRDVLEGNIRLTDVIVTSGFAAEEEEEEEKEEEEEEEEEKETL